MVAKPLHLVVIGVFYWQYFFGFGPGWRLGFLRVGGVERLEKPCQIAVLKGPKLGLEPTAITNS